MSPTASARITVTLVTITALLLAIAPAAAQDPVAAWDLGAITGDSIAELSGGEHSLEVFGASGGEAMGRGFVQTGPDAYAVGPALGDGWENLTLTAVVYQPRPSGKYAGIVARDNYGGSDGDAFGIICHQQDEWVGRVRTDAGQASVTCPIETGWHQLSLTYDGKVVRLFVDGELAADGALSGEIVREPDTPLVVGAYSNLNGWFTGGIAFASIHDRALTAEELHLAWEAWEAANPLSNEFTFAQAADTHVTDTKSVEIVNDAVDMINADPRVAFSLWLGDLTQHSTEDEMALARMALDRLEQPRYTLRGNHDQRDGLYEQEFGELNYTFEHAGWKFIMLDTNPGDKTPIDEERMQWLRDVLDETDSDQPLVLCTHHPLAPGVGLRLAGADDVLALFSEHNLKAVLGGHHHGNHEETVDGVLYTKNACLATTRVNFDGDTERGYRLFHCTEDGITSEFVPVRDVQPEDVQQ
ncbi:MAG: metallophosphoesterase [Armatimonadota bacterium]